MIKDDKKQLDAAISKWFDETPIIVRMGLKEELLEPCDEEFKKLLKMIQCVLHKKRCIKAITATTSELRKLEHVVATTRFNHMHELDQILSKIDKEKIQDLSDAVKCAHFGIYKASAVLGWGAAMFCIRHEIEKEGFEKLNRICKEMSQADNRYRQLKKIGTVSNHASLQEIPDSSILLIAECYGMIDNGQRKRLLSDMNTRHTSAHTGDAATTRLNLLSLYSNLNKFIFSKFQK
ncbi:MAG: hypothetical protein MPK62_02565 [Alphaproteobacteria bacterium]|nr:hypothetical protein [Alphaproteobacteria bacterium]MDA8030015.1 hypothetical protein [Alphaproteobacteria bacterium]